jgi:hypothetical protein
VSELDATVAGVDPNDTAVLANPVPKILVVFPALPINGCMSPMWGDVVPREGLYDQTQVSPPERLKPAIWF